jgi:hypothetical protein
MASKIGKGEWKMLYVGTGFLDLVQIILDFFAIGVAANPIIDFVFGFVLLGYFQIRGVNMLTKPSRVLSILGFEILDDITGGLAPAWIIDVWYIKRSVDQENANNQTAITQQQFLNSHKKQPLYSNGSRQPTPTLRNANLGPRYSDGMRAPGGNLTTKTFRAKI